MSAELPPIDFASHEDRLRAEMAEASAELTAHMASWEYAFAMGQSCNGGSEHPVHWATRARTVTLAERYQGLKAQLGEFTVEATGGNNG